MTLRRVVLYGATTLALANIAACALILHTANHLEQRRRDFPRCLP